MPSYWPIRGIRDDTIRTRTIENLIALREKLGREVRRYKSDGTVLLATWNIRDFDKNRFGYGKRLTESMHYIAEVVSSFDLVALQEVNRDTTGLEQLMKLLGPNWSYIMTDTTEGSGGNMERMAFVYDTRRVIFRNLAGEIVLPKKSRIGKELQFARTPFLTGFQAGWFKMNLCSVHIYYGAASGEKLARRVEEIERLSKYFEKLQEKEAANYVLLGDFNIVSEDDATMNALKAGGFRIPKPLRGHESNLKGTHMYDQIAIKEKDRIAEVTKAGVFRFDEVVFRDDPRDFETYKSHLPKRHAKGKTGAELRDVYTKWRTWQVSDHLPLWACIKTDFTEDYLNSLKPDQAPLAMPD